MKTSPVKDYFALFGLVPAYALDKAALEAAYHRLSLAHHPDFHLDSSAETLAEAERMSALINQAYAVLADEWERARYLLKWWSQGVERDPKALPPGFLEEVFVLQETWEESQGAQREAFVADITQREAAFTAKRSAVFAEIFSAIESQGSPTPDPSLLKTLQRNLNCQRYYRRFQKQAAKAFAEESR